MKLIMVMLAMLASVGIVLAPQASACDPGSYYDSLHQICVGYIPSKPQPGYPQICSGGYYDASHDICAPFQPSSPLPLYPWG